jgi:DNA-binding PucR family transcriptional regulator
MATRTVDEIDRLAEERVAEIGAAMGAQMSELVGVLHGVLAGINEETSGDQQVMDLLYASIESNLETLAHITRYSLPVDEVSSTLEAEEYARRLAQRGISSTVLVRAYRLGQQLVLDWVFGELARDEPDAQVAFAASRQFTDLTFKYVDLISEQVVVAYETERERWLAHRSTVRAAMVTELLAGENIDAGTAEQALGYRLRQHHLGAVLWGADVRVLEKTLGSLGKALGASGQLLFFPRDRSTGWGWLPLGREAAGIDLDAAAAELGAQESLRIALGSPGPGLTGFRVTHLEAVRAQQVALAAQATAPPITSYVDPEVRTAAMLTSDLEAARRLVAKSLGGLAADTEGAERLRETLLTFLSEKGSYTATAERVHLHKNTVRYRVDRAVEERGRPLDDERLELELALVAARWLGASVLRPPG